MAGLGALTVLLFADVLFRGRVLYERDIHVVWHGQVESFVRCIASGSWPVWDPYLSFGQPLLANPGTQVLYPWTWLNLVARPAAVYTAYAAFHVAFAGIGLYLLIRRLGLSRLAAFTAGAVWMASGPLLSLVSLWHHLAGAAWMPWVVLAADRAFRSPGPRGAAILGAVLAGQVLAGSADMCAMTGLMVAAYALPLLLRSGSLRAAGTIVGTGAAAVALAAGLTAALWMPAVDTARRAARWDMPEHMRTVWSVHPASLVQVALPLLPGDLPLTAAVRRMLFDVPDPFLSSLHIGLPALVLAAAAFAVPRPPWVFGSVAVAAVLIALGRHAWSYGVAVALLPPLQILRYPSKAMVPAAFAAAVLCAYGLEAWRATSVRARRWRLLVAAPAALGAVLAWTAAYLALNPARWISGMLESSPGASSPSLAAVVPKLAVAGALASVAAFLAWRRPVRSGTGAAAVMAALAVGGIFWAHRTLNPTAPADFYDYRPQVVDVLKRDHASRVYVLDYVRVAGKAYRRRVPAGFFTEGPASPIEAALGLQACLRPLTAVRWGLFGSYDADVYSLFIPQLKSLMLVLRAAEETPLQERLLRMGAVDHVVAVHREGLEALDLVAVAPTPFAAPVHVYRVPGAGPRSYVVSGTRIADGAAAYRALADPSFDPAREIVLPEGRPEPPGEAPAGASRVLELRHDRVRLEADLVRAGYLVLADTYDPGWKASVDGQPAPVLRANAGFRAVRLEPGRHQVEMVYRPASVVAGAALSAATLLLGCGAAAARVWAR
jgi:hypothetical protein